MASPSIGSSASIIYCTKCGSKINGSDKFCQNCGASTAPGMAVAPSSEHPNQLEFERHLRVAWSCLKDVETKTDEIRSAKDAGDREVNEGTLRGTIAATALQGRLEKEFHDSLNLAWTSAVKASEIDGDGHVDIDGAIITPKVILGGVCGLRGDLKFALDKWEEAVGFYNQALQYMPESPELYFNIGAAYTNKHDPVAATSAFQTVIQLDPIGRNGIEAAKNLEKLKTGGLGKKGFTGSWKVLAVLAGMTLLAVIFAADGSGVGIMRVIVLGGILALYWWRKFK